MKAAQRKSRTPMVQRYKMGLELKFPEEVSVSGEILMETIIDAIFAYDSQNRLIPGEPLPPGGERLIGTVIGVNEYETEADWISGPRTFSLPDYWDEANPERDAISNLEELIREHIEVLDNIRARLASAYDGITLTEGHDAFTAGRRKAARVAKQEKGKVLKLIPDAVSKLEALSNT